MVLLERGGGLARSPGRDIWLLEMPRRVLRLAAPGERLAAGEEEEEEEGPRVISGTELERFMLLRAAFFARRFLSHRLLWTQFFSCGEKL